MQSSSDQDSQLVSEFRNEAWQRHHKKDKSPRRQQETNRHPRIEHDGARNLPPKCTRTWTIRRETKAATRESTRRGAHGSPGISRGRRRAGSAPRDAGGRVEEEKPGSGCASFPCSVLASFSNGGPARGLTRRGIERRRGSRGECWCGAAPGGRPARHGDDEGRWPPGTWLIRRPLLRGGRATARQAAGRASH